MHPYLTELALAERQRELAAEAARRRLAALATCCRPSPLARAVARLRDAWAGLTATGSQACCATA